MFKVQTGEPERRAAGEVMQLDEASFRAVVLGAAEPVLVDFFADWCAPCKVLAPTIAELARDFAGRAAVAKVNVDHSPSLAERYRIRSVPTVLLFDRGEVAQQWVGVRHRFEYERAMLALRDQANGSASGGPS
jgi:thioredoxin 1